MAVGGGGGGPGAGAARGDDERMRVYGRVVAILPRVEALVAGRARLEAVNELQHEFWEARDALLQRRLLQAEESRRRWEAAYIDLQPSGNDRRFAELQESDFEDLTTFVDVLAAENTEFQIKVKEVKGGMEHSQNAENHENITRDLKTELWKLKHTYEAVCSQKNNVISLVTAERDFFRYQFKTLERDYADLLSHSNKKAARATEAEQELQQNIKQMQVVSQKKDDEIPRLRAQAKARAAEAKRKFVPQGKEISQITAERDFVRDRFKTLERDYADLLSYMKKKETRATEAAQELQKNIKQLQVASQKKDDEIRRLRAQAKAKAAEAKRKFVPEGKLPKMDSMPKELQDWQPETSLKHKKDMIETHTKVFSEGPALRPEAEDYFSKQMLAGDGQPEASQKRKCVSFLSNDDEQNRNDCRTSNEVLEPLKKKTVSGKRVADQENNKELASGKIHDEINQSPLAIYNALIYLRGMMDSLTDKPEKHAEFLAVQREFVGKRISISAFIRAVKVLLDGHPELIRGFESCFTCTPTQGLGRTDTKC